MSKQLTLHKILGEKKFMKLETVSGVTIFTQVKIFHLHQGSSSGMMKETRVPPTQLSTFKKNDQLLLHKKTVQGFKLKFSGLLLWTIKHSATEAPRKKRSTMHMYLVTRKDPKPVFRNIHIFQWSKEIYENAAIWQNAQFYISINQSFFGEHAPKLKKQCALSHA